MKVDLRDLRRLLSQSQKVLQALDMPCRDEARRTLDFAAFMVPQGPNLAGNGEPPLSSTAFLAGPLYNMEVLSTTFLAGYSHPAAGAIHEGFHWGEETVHPRPRWMRAAFKGAKGRARKAVAATLAQALRRFFPAT
ncbi:MAG: hypothetical protein ACJ8AT_06180 [Hyalangium sp.]